MSECTCGHGTEAHLAGCVVPGCGCERTVPVSSLAACGLTYGDYHYYRPEMMCVCGRAAHLVSRNVDWCEECNAWHPPDANCGDQT